MQPRVFGFAVAMKETHSSRQAWPGSVEPGVFQPEVAWMVLVVLAQAVTDVEAGHSAQVARTSAGRTSARLLRTLNRGQPIELLAYPAEDVPWLAGVVNSCRRPAAGRLDICCHAPPRARRARCFQLLRQRDESRLQVADGSDGGGSHLAPR